nr:class I poly(R)-hydroxyalkanoic acid synthase [Methylopila sp. M107]
MARLWEAGGKAMAAYVGPRERGEKKSSSAEIVDIARTLGQVVEKWASDPDRVLAAQREFAGGFLDLWTGTLKRLSGEKVAPVVALDPKDARFKDPEWTEHPFFDFLRQSYLQASKLANRMVDDVDDLDPHLRHKASFYVKLLSNAASPSNFLPTNPELIRETIASKGENLVRGMNMLAEDIKAGGGDLRIRQTDGSGFEVGRNLATTPGKVVFRNDVFELIQYSPTTEMVRTRPVLIVPPWINKFYVLDLTPEKSMIRWHVDQGVTVFCISWINPDSRHAKMGFDGYMRDGIIKAADVANEICGTSQIDTIGYCVGGTLLAVTVTYMAMTGDDRIASATLMTTQVDFTEAGDLKVFADEDQIAAVEAKMAEQGYLEGAGMANAFNLIRSNDMIFPYLVNNYLKGKAPFPFDLLYWNSDATRMPAANHSFYLRGCYLNNELARGKMEVAGEILDLKRVRIPIYELAAREDHIAPPQSVFSGAKLFGGPVRFVLAGSGHIAGVVNPPAKMKYQYWVGGEVEGTLQDWIAHAEEKPGSWWPDWRAWIATLDATMVPARTPGEGKYEALCDAPGTYVKIRS